MNVDGSRPEETEDLISESQNKSNGVKFSVPIETQNGEISVVELQKSGDASKSDRGTWSGRFDFLMSLVAYAVGLGNS